MVGSATDRLSIALPNDLHRNGATGITNIANGPDPCVRLYDMGSPRDTSAELVPVDDVGVVVTESAEDVSLPARNPILALQHMEAALVRADLEHPDVLTPEEFRRLRYLISLARLDVFEPGPLVLAVCAVVVTFRSVRSWLVFGSR
jgi:hypothetical protein